MARPGNEELLRRAHGILVDNGFILEGPVMADGSRHYCNTTEKPQGRKASYTVHLGARPRVRMKWYYRSEPDDWKQVRLCDAGPLTPEQEAAYRAELARAQEARAQEAEAAAKQARARLQKYGTPADGTEDYLNAKGLPAVPGLWRMQHGGGMLAVAARNAAGEVRFLQYIWFDQKAGRFTKMFTKGCAPRGCFFEIEYAGEDRGPDVYLCEGIATGISIWQAMRSRVIVCFDCGNLLPVAQALIAAGRLEGSRCIFAADNDWGRDPKPDGRPDNPGVQHAMEAARAVGGAICVPAEDGETFPDGGAMTDANDVAMAKGLDVLAQRLGVAETPTGPMPDEAPLPMDPDMFPEPDLDSMPDYMMDGHGGTADAEPMPLRRPTPPQAAYPVDAFGPVAGAVGALTECCYVHPSVAGIVVLCSLSLLVQRLFNVKCPDFDFTPLSLFGLSVMESGGGKDLVEGLALRPMKEWERARKPEYDAQMEAYSLDEKVYQKALKMLERRYQNADQFDQEQYKAELKELEKGKPLPPVQPVLTSGDLNMEGLFRLLKERTPSHGIMGAEGGILFGGLAFQQENRMRTQGMLCAAWSKGELDKGRMGEGLTKLWNRRVCMDLLLQPSVAEELFADRGMVAQGFLPRFLITWPEITGRDLPGVDVASLPEMQDYYQACKDLMARRPPENDMPGSELELEELKLQGEAYAMYREFYREIEGAIVPGGRYEPVRAYARRGAEQAMRIAGVLAAAWAPYGDDVPVEAMASGIRLARWHLDEALRITLHEAEPPKIKEADTLLRWLEAKDIDRTSTSQIMLYGPGSLRTKEAVDSAVRTLLAHGWLKDAGPGVVRMGNSGKTAKARRTYLVVSHGSRN